jgi:hypothetical protein
LIALLLVSARLLLLSLENAIPIQMFRQHNAIIIERSRARAPVGGTGTTAGTIGLVIAFGITGRRQGSEAHQSLLGGERGL